MLVPLLLMQALADLKAGEGEFKPESLSAIEEALARNLFEYEVLLEFNTAAQSLRASGPGGGEILFSVGGGDRIKLRIVWDTHADGFARAPDIRNFRSEHSVISIAPSPEGCTSARLSGDFELIEVESAEAVEQTKDFQPGFPIVLRGKHAAGGVSLTCGAQVVENSDLSRVDSFELLLELPGPYLFAFREDGWANKDDSDWTAYRTATMHDWKMTYRLRPLD